MDNQKTLMAEVAFLYYKKGLTQQEIAKLLNITRQTVSKLLSSAIEEKIVEIIIRDPEKNRKEITEKLEKKYGIKFIVCAVSKKNNELIQLATTEGAIKYLQPILSQKNLRIGLSWGKSVQSVIQSFPETKTEGITVFPLFGATEHEETYFLSNELTREFATKIEAQVKFAWFPYRVGNAEDYNLFKRTEYYNNMQKNWDNLDIAILGIGNNDRFRMLAKEMQISSADKNIVGDVATHFFTVNGILVPTDELTLRISSEQLKKVKNKVAIAYGKDKVTAIEGAIRSGFVDTLITDEYTAELILKTLS